MTEGHPAIETVGLTKRFSPRRSVRPPFRRAPDKVALDDVSLAIRPGEVFGLLGPNGAGKTTLVKILSTLTLPTGGKALVSGLDVVKHSQEVRRRVGVIYGDERTFFWRLSAIENLRFYAALYRIPRRRAEARIRDLLAVVDLEKSAHIQMHHFSTGMRQRAAIARGLLNDPEILFMDEPTRGLDPLAALEMRKFVGEHVADGTRTVLVATHSMAEAEELCHRLAFLNHGQIQLTGTIQQLREALRVEDVHTLEVSHVDERSLAGLSNVPGLRSLHLTPATEPSAYHLEVAVQRGSAAVPTLIRRIVELGGDIWSSTPRELSLESMFAIAVGQDSHHLDGKHTESVAMADRGPVAPTVGEGMR